MPHAKAVRGFPQLRTALFFARCKLAQQAGDVPEGKGSGVNSPTTGAVRHVSNQSRRPKRLTSPDPPSIINATMSHVCHAPFRLFSAAAIALAPTVLFASWVMGQEPSFQRDVMAVLSKACCNSGGGEM